MAVRPLVDPAATMAVRPLEDPAATTAVPPPTDPATTMAVPPLTDPATTMAVAAAHGSRHHHGRAAAGRPCGHHDSDTIGRSWVDRFFADGNAAAPDFGIVTHGRNGRAPQSTPKTVGTRPADPGHTSKNATSREDNSVTTETPAGTVKFGRRKEED